ncbi:hypothetical protein FRB99_008339 [Tulasnella sp. 403]|nr:hypothetical protein FRB99_008339 [Tulasnella sp. 403]
MDPSNTATLIASATQSIAAASSSAAEGQNTKSGGLKVVGVILAITSGLLIGSSFVFKKKGLINSQAGGVAGEGVAYLKSWLWWTGMIMMILGELCNFAAYAFVDAVVVTPLGALSVVICAILSSIFLKETLTFFGWVGCGLSIVGSIIIALNGPQEQAVSTINEFQHLFLAPGFLVFGSVLIIGSLVIIFFFAPKYGKKNMIWYIAVCSMIGGLSVSCIQGLGAAIITTAKGDSQFKQWFTYFLIIFVTVTLPSPVTSSNHTGAVIAVTEIYYLNVALALFNTAMVTPTYYVIFTGCTLITSVVLYQGLKSTVTAILTVVMGFFVICAGIVILQMSKVDPESLNKLDRKSTILLKAAQQNVETHEKGISGMEDPGMDALRSFGTVGSIIRARSAKRMSQSSRGGRHRSMRSDLESGAGILDRSANRLSTHGLEHLPRHQLYDAPMPMRSTDTIDTEATLDPKSPTHKPTPPLPPTSSTSSSSPFPKSPRAPTIKFGTEDVAHYYPTKGKGGTAIHEPRAGNWNAPNTAIPSSSRGVAYENPTTPPRTAPPNQPSFPKYGDPFQTPPDSKSSTLLTALSEDQSMDSLALAGDGQRESPDPYDSPPLARGAPRRYPSRGSEDRDEQQRLVGRPSEGDSPEFEELRAGGIRLLPKVPKMDPL